MFKVFIARANIEKFNELISKENDPEKKALLKELLTREEDKLAAALIAISQTGTADEA
ncbi:MULTISPECIES: hypothetical protein [Sinorhizobium]|nr:MULTISPECIES: hypothetical protein [Sinorhizobium]AFL55150.1 hypothetical protein USDA257_p04350 [Sinorhizobium fredii USDA 257]AWI62217.1 hypothetical protein AB395_00006594 [Sinorhizobium fredii CCBAU 45436]